MLKKTEASEKKMKVVLNELGWTRIKYKYLLDTKQFCAIYGSKNLRPTKSTHWMVYLKENSSETYVCQPPKLLTDLFIQRAGECVSSENEIERKDRFFAAYCLYDVYFFERVKKDFKSAVLFLHYNNHWHWVN